MKRVRLACVNRFKNEKKKEVTRRYIRGARGKKGSLAFNYEMSAEDGREKKKETVVRDDVSFFTRVV